MIALRTIRQLSQISVILLACLSHSWHVYAFEEEEESPVENDLGDANIDDSDESFNNDLGDANRDDSDESFNNEETSNEEAKQATLKEVIEDALSQDVSEDASLRDVTNDVNQEDVDIAGYIAEMPEDRFMSLLQDLSAITAEGLSPDDRSILEAIQGRAEDFDITLSNIQELLDAISPSKSLNDVIGGDFSDVSKDGIDNMSDDTFRSLLDEIDKTDLSAITAEDLSLDDIRSLEAIQNKATEIGISPPPPKIQKLLEDRLNKIDQIVKELMDCR